VRLHHPRDADRADRPLLRALVFEVELLGIEPWVDRRDVVV
jgi:hypothetical protein